MIAGFLFDLDGVILDSNPVTEAFWGGWAEKEGVEFNETVIRQSIHGRTTWETIDILFHHLDQAAKQTIYDDGIVYDLQSKPALMPGVGALIKSIAGHNLPLILVTSSPRERALHFLKQHQLDQFLTKTVTGDDVVKGKPDPEPYQKGAALLGLDPAHCLVFEDSDSGIKSALSAGMRVVAINNPGFKSDRVVWNIPDFTALELLDADLTLDSGDQPQRLPILLP